MPLVQEIRSLSFETWLANHDEQHRARWCRELYPWHVFAQADYGDDAIGQRQRIAGCDLTVAGKAAGKVAARTELKVRLETAGGSRSAT